MSVNMQIARRAAAAAIALSFALPGIASVQADNTAQAVGGLLLGKPDLTAAVGFIDGKRWTNGGTLILNNPGFVQATQVGPQSNMCRFIQMDLQPKNSGQVDHGAFVTKVHRNNVLVHTEHFAPGDVPATHHSIFRKWTIDLKEGMNTVKVEMDANKQIAELKESNNNYLVRFNVHLDCDGDGVVNTGIVQSNSGGKKGHDAARPNLERPKPGSRPNSRPTSRPTSKPFPKPRG